MSNSILDAPLLRSDKPWWTPFLSFILTLYGILALGWNLQPMVILFWFEIILMAGASMVRVFFALDGRPFFQQLFQRMVLLVASSVMFGAMIMLAVTFSFKVFDGGMRTEGFEQIPTQIRILVAGYVLGLVLHFFANKRFQTAKPIGELMQTMVHLLVLLVLIMVLTMHLIPAYPSLDQAKWVGLSVLVVKFVVDLAFARTRNTFREIFAEA